MSNPLHFNTKKRLIEINRLHFESQGLRRCISCWQVKPLTLEYFHSHGSRGLNPTCKECRNPKLRIASADYYKRYKDEHGTTMTDAGRVARLKWKERNRERVLADSRRYSAEWRIKNRERHLTSLRVYWVENKERLSERSKEWRRNNPDKVRENNRRNNSKRPDSLRLKKREEYIRHKPRYLLNAHRRRSRLLSLPHTLTTEQWHDCLDYFSGRCAYCGSPAGLWITIAQDHFIALSKGGGTTADNIIPACHAQKNVPSGTPACNNSKGDKNAHDWIVSRFGKRKAITILKCIEEYFEWVKSRE